MYRPLDPFKYSNAEAATHEYVAIKEHDGQHSSVQEDGHVSYICVPRVLSAVGFGGV